MIQSGSSRSPGHRKAETVLSYLHLHHLPFAAGAQGPLVAGNAMVISALVPKQGDGVLGQGDHLVGACVGHRWVIHSFVHCQACSGGVGSSIRVYDSQAVRAERGVQSGRGINIRGLHIKAKKYQGGRVTNW